MSTAWAVFQWVAVVGFIVQLVAFGWFAWEIWRAPLLEEEDDELRNQ